MTQENNDDGIKVRSHAFPNVDGLSAFAKPRWSLLPPFRPKHILRNVVGFCVVLQKKKNRTVDSPRDPPGYPKGVSLGNLTRDPPGVPPEEPLGDPPGGTTDPPKDLARLQAYGTFYMYHVLFSTIHDDQETHNSRKGDGVRGSEICTEP